MGTVTNEGGLGEQWAASVNASAESDRKRPTLAALKARGFPRMTSEGLVEVKAPDAAGHEGEIDALRAALATHLDAYLAAFVTPEKPGFCIRCGAALGDFFGTFEWGLAYGEGRCSVCHYPARGLHRVRIGEYGEISMNQILQYHPADLEEG